MSESEEYEFAFADLTDDELAEEFTQLSEEQTQQVLYGADPELVDDVEQASAEYRG